MFHQPAIVSDLETLCEQYPKDQKLRAHNEMNEKASWYCVPFWR